MDNPKTTSTDGAVKPAKINPQKAKILSIALLLLASTSMGFIGGWLGSESRAKQPNAASSVTKQVVSNESQLFSQIAKEVGPSVVSVNVTSQSSQQDMFFGFGGFGNAPSVQQSAGTGVIISSEGLIVTNRHVVPSGSTNVSVVLSDGTTLNNVEIVGRTTANDPLDVAFLRIKDKKGKTLIPAKLGDSSKMQVGDKVLAIGNALGQFQNTVTSGIISGFGRSVQAGDSSGIGSSETLQDLFQTDAAINQGNSGGPLVNMNGEVIGINTAVAGNGENIGFAIPINDIQGIIKSVLTTGKLQRPYLGVRYISLNDDYANQFNLNVTRGAYIPPSSSAQPTILPGSPAEKAGVQEKDVITKVDDTKIDENNSLTSVLSRHSVGDTVTLTIIRGGKQTSIKATLEAAPNS